MVRTSENVAHYMKLLYVIKTQTNKQKVSVQISQKRKWCSAWHGSKGKQRMRVVYWRQGIRHAYGFSTSQILHLCRHSHYFPLGFPCAFSWYSGQWVHLAVSLSQPSLCLYQPPKLQLVMAPRWAWAVCGTAATRGCSAAACSGVSVGVSFLWYHWIGKLSSALCGFCMCKEWL